MGRPLKLAQVHGTPEKVAEVVQQWMDNVSDDHPPSIHELALVLGVDDSTLRLYVNDGYNREGVDYGQYADFIAPIKRAYQFGCAWWERALARGKNVVGAIFWLKNAPIGHWKDKQEVEHTAQYGGLVIEMDLSAGDDAPVLEAVGPKALPAK